MSNSHFYFLSSAKQQTKKQIVKSFTLLTSAAIQSPAYNTSRASEQDSSWISDRNEHQQPEHHSSIMFLKKAQKESNLRFLVFMLFLSGVE